MIVALLREMIYSTIATVIKDLKDSASYDRTQAGNKWVFWLSPLAAPLAFLRVLQNK